MSVQVTAVEQPPPAEAKPDDLRSLLAVELRELAGVFKLGSNGVVRDHVLAMAKHLENSKPDGLRSLLAVELHALANAFGSGSTECVRECLVTMAEHLEAASSLDAESRITALEAEVAALRKRVNILQPLVVA